jgi:hypothetical protein
MTPAHPKWAEFTTRLEGAEGCNFQDDGKTTWQCKGGMNKDFATAILASMGFDEQSITSSLKFFEANGGHCDCEILFNIA